MIDALNYIRLGTCDVSVSGGSEAAVVISGVGGFSAMHALSTRNETPTTASRLGGHEFLSRLELLRDLRLRQCHS